MRRQHSTTLNANLTTNNRFFTNDDWQRGRFENFESDHQYKSNHEASQVPNKISTTSPLVYPNMGWLGDSSHRGQVRQAWMAVGYRRGAPQRGVKMSMHLCLGRILNAQLSAHSSISIRLSKTWQSLQTAVTAPHQLATSIKWLSRLAQYDYIVTFMLDVWKIQDRRQIKNDRQYTN